MLNSYTTHQNKIDAHISDYYQRKSDRNVNSFEHKLVQRDTFYQWLRSHQIEPSNVNLVRTATNKQRKMKIIFHTPQAKHTFEKSQIPFDSDTIFTVGNNV